MTHPSDSVQEKLKGLRKIFSAQLPEKIAQIEESMLALVRDGWTPKKAEHAAQLLHTLAGTAGTFGFTAIRAAAKSAETLLRAGIKDGAMPSAGVLTTVSKQLAALKDSGGDGTAIPAASPVRAPMPLSIQSEHATVFVIDNDPLFVKSLTLQLCCYGYKVEAFSTIAALDSALCALTPLLIIMDISSIEELKAGRSTVAELQKKSGASIPVIFLSDRIDFESRLDAVRAGGNAYFVKPVDIGRLVDRLDAMTDRRPRAPFRILIVDDDPLLADYHATVLRQAGMTASVVTEPKRTLETLIDFRPELILMDMYMPRCSGMELANVIRQDETYIDIPIVYLSSETDIRRQLAAMGRGGDDFLTKPIQPSHLIASVTLRADRYRSLRSFMLYDGLTGLLNHTRTKEHLDVEMSRMSRQKSNLSFALIDIDHFKAVNDTYGHPIGDQVIQSLSRLLKQRLRTTDIVGRLGGEEFGVILSNTDGLTAQTILNELREDFGKIQHVTQLGNFSSTFSCGIACPGTDTPCAALISAADSALYAAKRSGRNLIVLGNTGDALSA